ncbi:hypothetical protein HRG_007598 [Hirsutella rhossiliensis]|uniref:Uncharacterized protein n=1 Tax=Hirsutella rhossiliensis TaxID=111463 RepID=A0A9P8SHG4_9HYPO|nr:uncharacterized protein HRG_07598 [Hirsutella rhossiliensis]KAH0961520.1 hypothetical protein HRG_07598 [Hirsutella rhossiliensis]
MAAASTSVESANPISDGWFSEQFDRHGGNNEILLSCLKEEIAVLEAYYQGKTSTGDAASAITRPISNSPAPALGGYSDEIVGLCQLWRVFTDALADWPSDRFADLVELLKAISEIPDSIHRGEALDDDGKESLTWNRLPYFSMVWFDKYWEEPRDIVEKCSTDEDKARAKEAYVTQQDSTARLVAAGILQRRKAFEYMTRALWAESEPKGDSDNWSDRSAMRQWILSFYISAVAAWMERTGHSVYLDLQSIDIQNRPPPAAPSGATKYSDRSREDWSSWKKRLLDVAQNESDEATKKAVTAAMETMEAVEKAAEK